MNTKLQTRTDESKLSRCGVKKFLGMRLHSEIRYIAKGVWFQYIYFKEILI